MYSSDDAPKYFFVNLIKDCTDLYVNYLSIVTPVNTLTPRQKIRQKEDTICHICKIILSPVDRVAYHWHLTGEYRRPTHSKCNLESQIEKFILILFHNLPSCDCHLFVREFPSIEGDIIVIPLNKELYVPLSKKFNADEKMLWKYVF